MRAFYKTRLYVSGSDRRVQFKNAIAEFFNPHVLPHRKGQPTPHNLLRFAAKLRRFWARALPEEAVVSNKELCCVLDPSGECIVTLSLFGVLPDHCSHFAHGAGALFDFGCYGADLMTWLMKGAVPITVTAVTQQLKPEIYPRVDDEATVILTYAKTQAILQASWNWPFDRKDMEIYGETGEAITVRRDGLRVRRKGDDQEQPESASPLTAPYDDPISYLIAVVSGEIKPAGLSSLDTNVTVIRILDAARESAKTGRTIRLADR
jgi:hypothetical protein